MWKDVNTSEWVTPVEPQTEGAWKLWEQELKSAPSSSWPSRILVNFDWNTKEVAPLFWSWNITINYVVSYFFLADEVVEKKRQFAYEILLFSVELKVIFISNTPQNTLSSSVNMYDGLWQDTWPIIA